MECGGCDGIYIGETGRQLKIRISERKNDLEKEKMGESTLADHLIDHGHTIKEGSEVLLHRRYSYFRRLALEHIEVNRYMNSDDVTLLNRHLPQGGLIDSIYEPYPDD